jgi:hypothetical protein
MPTPGVPIAMTGVPPVSGAMSAPAGMVCLPGFSWPVNGVRPIAPISLRSM